MVTVQSNGQVKEVTTECGVRFFCVAVRPFGHFRPQRDNDCPRGGLVSTVTGDFDSLVDAVESAKLKNAFLLRQQSGPCRVWYVVTAGRMEPESGDEIALDMPVCCFA